MLYYTRNDEPPLALKYCRLVLIKKRKMTTGVYDDADSIRIVGHTHRD